MPIRTSQPRKIFVGTLALLACVILSGCSASQSSAGNAGARAGGAEAPLQVYATTGYLADAIHNIAPAATVTTMVGPGGDPHTYQPSTKDIQSLMSADVVFWTGLNLEAQMVDQLTSLGDAQLAVGDQLPDELLLEWPDTDAEGNPLHDPHIWNSPAAWSQAVTLIAAKLGEIDPQNAAEYDTRARDYTAEIDAAAEAAHEVLEQIPEPRVLITGHDAFSYFGDTFDLEVHATDFVSSEAQLSPRALSDLADLIATSRVPVIFRDNQANPQAITSLTEAVHDRGWDVRVSSEELYADSLGAEPGVDTYLGVFAHNAQTVASALAGGGE